LFSYVFTLTKILCLAEDIDFLNRPGVILSLVWSLGATAVLGYLTYTLPVIPSKYSNLWKLDRTRNKNEHAKDEETKRKEKLTTYDHIRVLLGYCKCEWKWLTAGFSAMLVFVVAEIFEPSATGYVLGSVIDKKGYHTLIMAVLFRIGITFIAIVFGGFAEGCMEYSTSLIARKLRLDLFTSLVFKDIAFFDVTNSGEMVSRLTADCQTVSTAVSSNLTQFIRSSVLIIGSLSFLLFYSWRMTLVTFITFPLMIILTKIYGSFYDAPGSASKCFDPNKNPNTFTALVTFQKLSESTQSTMAKANQIAAEVLSTMRTVRSFACEKREIARFSRMLNSVLKYDRKRSLAASGYIWSCDIAESLTVAVILLYGGHLVFSDKMSSGILVTYILYLEQLENNLYILGSAMTQVMNCVGASRKIFAYMTDDSDKAESNGKEKPEITGKIELTSVNFSYPSRPNRKVLEDVNLTLESGQTVAFVGASGGGKSTFVSLIERFYKPTSGSIFVDGTPIDRIDHEYFHEKVALVAQEPVLYNGSIRENIVYGCEWATEEDMLRAAQTANVHEFVMQLENGYETNCGERGAQLSGGQKQRIAIARALVRRPAVLILDEATSALDSHSEDAVQEALKRIAGKLTVIIIAHRLSTIEHADRICVVSNGRVVQTGTHSELLKDVGGLYHSLVARQSPSP
ncbi:ABC transporter, ATP-binding protein, partial [Ancylostoma caninum]